MTAEPEQMILAGSILLQLLCSIRHRAAHSVLSQYLLIVLFRRIDDDLGCARKPFSFSAVRRKIFGNGLPTNPGRFASVLQDGRKNTNIHANVAVVWGMSEKMHFERNGLSAETLGSYAMNWRDRHIRLRRLEAEAIYIMREAAAEFENPVMLYSVGKDSSVMLYIAQKAFYPAKPPFPLLHVDTTWKFREMIAFRDETAARIGMDLLVHVNDEGLTRGISPVSSGSAIHTQVMKTEALRQALGKWHFDVAFGGARRDEEKSRAKERIFSHRSASHGWDPRNQSPELWRLFNTRIKQAESMRVFPLSNWTELDVWEYIRAENIPVVPLYFAKQRPVVERDDVLIMIDDDRLPLLPGETPRMMRVRFRTLGCYPLTGAIPSNADTLDAIIAEMRGSTSSERQGRVIDNDESGSMEKKKREGYF